MLAEVTVENVHNCQGAKQNEWYFVM